MPSLIRPRGAGRPPHPEADAVKVGSGCPSPAFPKQPGRLYTPSVLTLLVATLLGQEALAYDVTERLALGGTLAMATQCQQVSGAGDENKCGGGAALMPDLTLNLTDRDQVYLLFDFALGNDLNADSPFALAPWAASLEEDVKDINGSNRSYLLVATYSHDFQFADDHALRFTGGILDTGAFLDQNAYASDENTQFMNVAFANSHSSYLPTYDPGGAMEWRYQDWTLTALGLNGEENEAGEPFSYYAAGLAYRLGTAWGEGNYRLMYFTTTPDFAATPGAGLDRAEGAVLSLDQELGNGWGVFLRLVWQGDALLGDYIAGYTGGLNVLGTAWGRARDNLGLALGYLEGPAGAPSPGGGGPMDAPPDEPSLASTWIGEAYYRFVATDWLALSADIQYMNDRYRAGEDVRGWVFGLRATLDF